MSYAHADVLPANLAANLRYVRQRRNLTQARAATLAGVPRSTLALLETGSGNPTLLVLARLAGALQVSIEELIAPPRNDARVYRNGQLRIEQRGKVGRKVELRSLLPDPIPGMQIDRLELGPGAKMMGAPHPPGTREYLVCERGRMVLQAGGERYELGFGDVVSYQGDQPHSYWNEGNTTAVGFSVVAIAPPGLR